MSIMSLLWLILSMAWAFSSIAPTPACRHPSIGALKLPEDIPAGTPAEQAPDCGAQRGQTYFRTDSGKLLHTKKGVQRAGQSGLGFTPAGHKREGDGKTPEGLYATSDKPWSQYYAAIAVHYPGIKDALAAEEDSRIAPVISQTHKARARGEEASSDHTDRR